MPPEDVGLDVPEDAGTTPDLTTAEDRPDWLPDKFKTPEAFVESYTNLEREFTSTRQNMSQMQDEMDSLVEQMQVQQQPSQDPTGHPLIAAIVRATEDGDYANAALLQAQLNLEVQAAQQSQAPEPEEDLGPLGQLAEINARQRWGDQYDQLQEEATRILEQHPNLVPDGTLAGITAGLNTALELAHGRALAGEQQSLASQQAEREASRQRKLAAQTASGSGPRPAPPDEQKQTWERIKAAGEGRFSTS